jgi:hypothetical protein
MFFELLVEEIRHVSRPSIRFRRYAHGRIVYLAGRADSPTIAGSTDTAATTEPQTEMHRQRHLCQQQGRNSEAPRELLGRASRRYRAMPRWKLQFQPEPPRNVFPSWRRSKMAISSLLCYNLAVLRLRPSSWAMPLAYVLLSYQQLFLEIHMLSTEDG